jgi:hypothetical protein
MKQTNKLFAFFALVVISTTSAFAVTKTWNGSTSNAWSTASNWAPSGVPATGDDVIIPANLSRYPSTSGAVTIRNFTINGGDIQLNGNDFTVTNNFIVNNGTIQSASSEVDADDIDLNGGEFKIQGDKLVLGNDLTIDGGILTITGTDLTVDNDLFFLSGYIDMDGFNMIVLDDFTFEGGEYQNEGDFIRTRNFIYDPAGATHNLNFELQITNQFTFQSGILVTNSTHMVVFDNNASASGANDDRHIVGPVKKEVANNNNNTFTFPIGTGGTYAPIRISDHQQEQTGDFFIAQYFSGRHPQAGGNFGSGIDHVSLAEYWILDRGAVSGTPTTDVNVRLTYDENTRSGLVNSGNDLRVARWNGSQWVNQGGQGNSNSAGTITTTTRVTNFSPFTIGSSTSANPLPIALLDFNAKPVNNSVNIKWSTTSEINNDFFTIEKSVNGTEWMSIGTVKGVGNSEVLTNYNMIDPSPVAGVQFYRLKQTDIDGEFTYSSIVPVKFGSVAISEIVMYPMPATSVLNIDLTNDAESVVDIKILNTLGQVVLNTTVTGSAHQIDIQNLLPGIYFVEVSTEGTVTKSKLVKN